MTSKVTVKSCALTLNGNWTFIDERVNEYKWLYISSLDPIYTETKVIKENCQITNSLKEGKTVTVTF